MDTARCKPGQDLTCCSVVAAAEAAGASRKRLAEASCARQEADGAAMASLGSLAQEHAGCAAGEGGMHCCTFMHLASIKASVGNTRWVQANCEMA